MKHDLGRADDSAYEITERYSLLSTPDSYTLEFKVGEEVDFVFGDSAFSKPGNNVKSLLAEIMKPSREKQLPHFCLSKTEPIRNIEGEKHKDFQPLIGREVAKAITLGNCMFLKEIGTVRTVQRHGPIVDKVKDARKVIELATLYDFEVPTTSQERSISLCLESDARNDIDLRANLFQEEGNDTIMESIKDDQDWTLFKPLEETQEHELDNFKDALTRIIQVILVKEDNQRTVGSFYDEIMKLPKKTHLHCSAQMKSEINWFNSMTTWIKFSTHQKLMSKWNQFNQSSDEGDIEFTSQMILSLLDLDQRTFNNYFQPNQKESSYETNYSGILNHQRIWENWIPNNAGSDLVDMNFTSQWFCFEPFCATEPKLMMPSPTQVRYQRKTNWRILLDLLGFQQAQEQKKWTSDHKVIAHLPKRVNLVLYLKNSKPSPIKSLQNYVWHPGTSIKPKGQCMAQNKVSNSWS